MHEALFVHRASRYESLMIHLDRRLALVSALFLAACAAPEPAPPAAPTAAPAESEDAIARRAVGTALTSLSKRNFDVTPCGAHEARVVPETTARAGEPVGDRCTLLVGRRTDKSWLVSVRSATRDAPTRAGGSLAVVIVTANGEGVAKIEYMP